MGRIQQKVGKEAENKVRGILHDAGVYNFKMTTGSNGTVFDILAVHDNICYAFEVKHVKRGKEFRLNNQIQKKFDELERYHKSNSHLYLVVWFEEFGSIRILDIDLAIKMLKILGGVHMDLIPNYEFKNWVDVYME